jgi:hypothetical protein
LVYVLDTSCGLFCEGSRERWWSKVYSGFTWSGIVVNNGGPFETGKPVGRRQLHLKMSILEYSAGCVP